MEQYIEIITINLIPGGMKSACHAKQYDKGRVIRANLVNGLTPYSIKSGDVITLNVKKPDGNIVTVEVEATEGNTYVDFSTTEQMCAVAGKNNCEFSIENGSDLIGTANFFMIVEASPLEGGVESESEINNLTRQVHDIVIEELEDSGAEETGYDNTESGLEATNVQDAIDELKNEIDNLPAVDAYTKEESNEKFATNTNVNALTEKFDDITEVVVGKNKVNPATLTAGAIQSNGTISTSGAWAGYDTTDYIELKANTDYTFTNYQKSDGVRMVSRRLIEFYDALKTPISAAYINDVSGATTFNSGSYAFVRVSASNISNFQLEEGSTYSAYTPYSETTTISTLLGTIPTEQVKTMIDDSMPDRDKTIVISNGLVKVTSALKSSVLEREYYLYGSNNHNFRFGNTKLNGNIIKSSTDDITPQRVRINALDSATIGANHGWDYGYKAPVGSFTPIDIGSIWSDGTTEYTLCSLDGGAIFVPPVSKTDEVIQVTKIPPVANLHHVSGATHTTDVNLADITQAQLYPSTNKGKVELFIDGKKVTANGTYKGDKIIFKESYGVIDLYELVEYVRSNVGDVDYDDIQDLFTMHYVYEITDNGEVVFSTLIADEYVYIVNSGFMQAAVMTAITGGTIYRYVNGVASGIFDSTDLVDMSSYSITNYITPGMMIEGQVPNRSVDVCKDDQGNILYGFALGFIPDLGNGADAKRSLNSRLWDMRDNKKSYPYCIENLELDSGEQVDVVGYRTYFDAMTDATDEFAVEVGDKTYLVFDAHSISAGNIKCDKYGSNVVIVNNDGSTIGDFVSAVGVSHSSEESYTAFVVKVGSE